MMKAETQYSKTRKTFGKGLSVDALRPRYKEATKGAGSKPRAIANPGSRSGLRKGAGG